MNMTNILQPQGVQEVFVLLLKMRRNQAVLPLSLTSGETSNDTFLCGVYQIKIMLLSEIKIQCLKV